VTNDEPESDEHEARAVDRLIFFSDAVTAIAITLLAVDLPPPSGGTVSAFWSSVRQNDLSYLGFLVSFLAISAAWSHHHDVFQYARRTDSRLRTLNMIWLLMIVLITFSTRVLTTNGQDTLGANALRWGFYALVQVLTSAALFAMRRHMISHHLQQPGTESKDGSDWDWRAYGPILGFGLSIPVFFVTPYAWVLWIVMPTLVMQLRRLQRRDQPGPEATRLVASQLIFRRADARRSRPRYDAGTWVV
jgi:uncharacterized membrane protein